MNQSLGMDIIYRLSGITAVPFNAPLGGIYGEWAEICGTWLLHPDNIHPLSIYLREDKVAPFNMVKIKVIKSGDSYLRWKSRRLKLVTCR